MGDEAELLSETWESIKDFLAPGSVNDAAKAVVAVFLDHGIDIRDLLEAGEDCPYLERALEAHRDDESEDEDEEEE